MREKCVALVMFVFDTRSRFVPQIGLQLRWYCIPVHARNPILGRGSLIVD